MSAGGMKLSRRGFGLTAAAIAAASAGCARPKPERPPAPPGTSAVFVAKAASYAVELESLVAAGVRECGLVVKEKHVLLKPNLVEFDASTAINTNVAVIAAALEVFRKLGAASVRIGEGPGHRRDTVFVTEQAAYRSSISGFDDLFVDLNRDDVRLVKGFAGREEFFFPKTALEADLIVSVAKMKTHHWAGATLSMKNLFGLVPGAVYGWPKNVLHQIGIPNSIVALRRAFPKTFSIVDGVVGMEGNGPIQGQARAAGVLAMGADPIAVDATCCRIMGIDPEHVAYLVQASDTGHLDEAQIEQRGEAWRAVRTDFRLIGEMEHARLGTS